MASNKNKTSTTITKLRKARSGVPNIQESLVAKLNMQIRDDGAKQTRRRKQRERHLKIWLRVSAIISQLFRSITLVKCVLSKN